MASSSRGVDKRPRSERMTTILSIDGGGIRGLVPLAIIASLEQKLQEIEKKNGREESDVRIADYFDVIAGTSTGGLIAAMLAVPDKGSKDPEKRRRPKNTAEDIKNFYYKHGEKIFTPATRWFGLLSDAVLLHHLGWVGDLIRAKMAGPKYDEKELHDTIGEQMSYTPIGGGKKKVDLTLADTLSNLVVPTFDVKRLAPVIFSSFPAKRGDNINRVEVKPSLANVCIATSAAPTFFPPWWFKGMYDDGTPQSEFHLVNGGLAANNPTMVAIARVARNAAEKNESFDCKKCLVLSIGTGYARERDTYDVGKCAKWSDLDWIKKDDRTPIIDMLGHANEFLVNLNAAVLFHTCGVPENYLRIQAVSGSIEGPQKPMDAATPDDMVQLYAIGNSLLKKPLARISMATWNYWYVDAKFTNENLEPSEIAAGTHIINNPHKHLKMYEYLHFNTSNDDELQNFAYKLCNERRQREGLPPLVHQGGGGTEEVK